MIGTLLAWALAAGMAVLGVAACAVPDLASTLYGVPEGAAWVSLATALVAVCDIVNVVASRGPVPQLVVHASGVGMGLAAGLLLLG